MAIYGFKSDFFNSIFRIWTDEVSRLHLNMIQLFKKNLSQARNWLTLYHPEKHSALLQLCCNSSLMKLPLVPQRKKKHPKENFWKKKNGKYFFYKTFFLMKKIQGNVWFPFRKIKFKKLCSKKISTRKIAENELFWFFGRFLAFWAQKWPKIGPKIGPNNKFELWVPKRVHRRGLTPFLKNSDFFLPIPNRFKHCVIGRISI